MEDGKQAFLQHGLEVDEHVTAADESQLAEWRVGKHVVRGKYDHFSDIFANLVLVVALDEEPGEALGGNIVHDAFREYAFSSLFYGFGVAKILMSRWSFFSSMASWKSIARE